MISEIHTAGLRPEAPQAEMDIHSIPEHWKDEKHEVDGTAMAHLEIAEAVIASRRVLQSDLVDGPIQFTVGPNIGAQTLKTEMARLDGCRLLSLDMDKWGRIACYDDTSGDVLDPKLVQEARMLEVEYLTRMKVYDVVSRKTMKESGKGKLIKGRWLDVNKGDSTSPDIRSRYVGKEFATGVDASLYAGTPPLRP